MPGNPALRPSAGLRTMTAGVLVAWMVIAALPLVWIVAMSFKLPVDAFAADPLRVLLGPATRAADGGVSIFDGALGSAALWLLWRKLARRAGALAELLAPRGHMAAGWAIASVLLVGAALVLGAVLLPMARIADRMLSWTPLLGWLGRPAIGVTWMHYRAVWVQHAFWRNFLNSMVVTTGVVTISLTVGTLAAFALARSRTSLAFWLLIAALIFRAMPPSVLVAGYLPAFITSRDWLLPLWNAPLIGGLLHAISPAPPTLYGKPWAAIGALVAINQPFTIWMLRSFFHNIPVELDEAAQVDGCTYVQAFRRVIMPVMWPGVITTGLFSFLLAYNDYLVCAMLLDAQNQTMVPAITQYFNRETTGTDEVEAVAAAVSITAPLFLLVIGFQRQIVSGLTAGAVKG